jgi:AAA+ superfamily predicted ATPase
MVNDYEILDALDRVKEVTRDRISFELLPGELHMDLKPYTEFFNITDNQALILCACIYISLNRNEMISIQDLARFFDVSITTIAKQMDDINELTNQYILSEVNSNSRRPNARFSYMVKSEIIDAVIRQDFTKLNASLKFNFIEFFDYVDNIASQRMEGEIRTGELMLRLRELLAENQHLEFVKELNTYQLSERDQLITIMIASMHVEGEEDMDLNRLYRSIFDTRQEAFGLLRLVQSGNSDLIRKEIIEIKPGMFAGQEVRLTDRASSKLFSNNKVEISKKTYETTGISYKTISKRKLFYVSDVAKEIDKLKALLSEKKYQNARKIMQQNNMPIGMNILLYGLPGTGKTELVYQLARQTKRNIIPVVISDTKSKWFGESEKLIKKVFDDYRNLSKEEECVPILLFNEADAIFNTRMTGESSSVDQTRNAIQNILLQELENFEGILIATTNLTDNLDKAFDRRFLFKLNVGMPDAESRFNIWKVKLPKVKKPILKQLSTLYSLSGGQIDNVVRKVILNELVGEKADSIESLSLLCKQELSLSQKGQRTSIGFNNNNKIAV